MKQLSNSADSCGKPTDRPTAGRETILARIIFRENRFCHFATPSTADLCRAEVSSSVQRLIRASRSRSVWCRPSSLRLQNWVNIQAYPQSGVDRFDFVPIIFSSIILTSAPLRLCARLIRMPIQFSFSFSQGAEIAGNSTRLLCSFLKITNYDARQTISSTVAIADNSTYQRKLTFKNLISFRSENS